MRTDLNHHHPPDLMVTKKALGRFMQTTGRIAPRPTSSSGLLVKDLG